MQNRYVGDVGDFAKYGLLRALRPAKKLGVAWYLHPDEHGSADGRHIEYLCRPQEFEWLDSCLFVAMKALRSHGRISCVDAIAKSRILDDATFADEFLPIIDEVRDRPQRRREWFERVKGRLAGCDLVFVDPDNGLVLGDKFKPNRKNSAKRLPLCEVNQIAEAGRTVVIYHHNTRFRGGHKKEILYWMSRLPGSAHAFYWKRWSCRTFFIVNADETIEDCLKTFAKKWCTCGELISNPEYN